MADNVQVTAPTPDAVAQAKAKFLGFVEARGFMDPTQFPDEMAALDALIAAVRAECAAVTNARAEVLRNTLAREGYGSIRLTDARAALRAAMEAQP